MEQSLDQGVSGAITGWDIAVLAAYFLVIIVIGVWVSRKTEDGEDLFLAGRSLTWGVIGFSLFASNISSTTLIGLTGAAYSTGIAVSAYEWMAGIPLILLAFVFAPLFFKARVTTIPEWLERRYDRRTRLYFSGVTIALTTAIDTAGGLYAGGVVMQSFFPQIPVWQTCVGLGVFAGLYTASGGLRAVVYTDVLQAVVLILGAAAMTLILFARLDFSWATVMENVPSEDHMSMVLPRDNDILPWPGLMLGVPILGFWYWVTNQYITQRVLGARSLAQAQWGSLLGGFLKLLPMFVMVLPGAMAITVVPGLDNPDEVFPTLTATVLPAGLTGLVLAGLVAAIMSSVDSTLNSSSTLVVHDFMRVSERHVDGRRVRWLGRTTTLVLMTLAVVWAPFITNFGGLWDYLQQAFSILVPPVVAIFLLGAFWGGTTAAGAFWTLAIGHAVGLLLFVLTQMGIWPLHFTTNVGVMTGASLLVALAISLAGKGAKADPDTIWRPSMALARDVERAPAWADARLLSAVLVAAMAGILVAFW